VAIDLDDFDDSMRQARESVAQGDLVAARTAYQHMAALYGGLPVFNKIDPIEAETYHNAAMHALRWLAADALAQQHNAQALKYAQRLVRDDRWDHENWRLLIEAYLAQNNRRAARRQYLRYRKLHDDPDEAVLQLGRRHHFD
jgi:DNA-binding SARP family transcriptional activator